MPQEELFINGKDAYTTWGISMDDTAPVSYTHLRAHET